jgi:hypothetical protein
VRVKLSGRSEDAEGEEEMGEGGEKEKREGRTTNAVEENIPQQLQVDTVGNTPVSPLNNSYREILHETRGFDPVPVPVTH